MMNTIFHIFTYRDGEFKFIPVLWEIPPPLPPRGNLFSTPASVIVKVEALKIPTAKRRGAAVIYTVQFSRSTTMHSPKKICQNWNCF
jgi:hypothetical protein